jgi:hypothetical protein
MERVHQAITESRLAVGTCVRVKTGVMDPDFPTTHMGDWSGMVSQVYDERPTTYLIQWNPETLEKADPSCQEYCKIEDMAVNQMWLLEDDLELVV